ncbi:MAG: putative protein-tyrosine phosphatase [uncultured archaeon A07HB70]|jgi:Predicted protein-tyrosine phosphatase|nr:MAG: putative protein-tyrosine phosphatase [uncultured archaeon A07HB70]
MDEVAPGLSVGTTADAAGADRSVDVVVSLTHETPDAAGPVVVDVPMCDGPRNDPSAFRRATDRTRAALDAGDRVLVRCSAGSSRSPAVAAAALVLHDGLAVETAFERVARHRTGVDPHAALVRRAVAAVEGARG